MFKCLCLKYEVRDNLVVVWPEDSCSSLQ